MPKVFENVLAERSSARYTAILKDEAGVLIPVANINTLTLTLFNLKDESIINTRSSQDVKNANNVTIDSNGLLTWEAMFYSVGASSGQTKPSNRVKHGLPSSNRRNFISACG